MPGIEQVVGYYGRALQQTSVTARCKQGFNSLSVYGFELFYEILVVWHFVCSFLYYAGEPNGTTRSGNNASSGSMIQAWKPDKAFFDEAAP